MVQSMLGSFVAAFMVGVMVLLLCVVLLVVLNRARRTTRKLGEPELPDLSHDRLPFNRRDNF